MLNYPEFILSKLSGQQLQQLENGAKLRHCSCGHYFCCELAKQETRCDRCHKIYGKKLSGEIDILLTEMKEW